MKGNVNKKDEYIIKEVESGDAFYILEEREVITTKTLEAGKAVEEIKRYGSWRIFWRKSFY